MMEVAHQHERVEVLESAGIEYLHGHASLKNRSALNIDGKEIIADIIIIATGSSAFTPIIKGLESVEYLTNQNIFQQEEYPKEMIVLGAGPIGVELSQTMQRLGVQVKLIARSRVLSHEEEEMPLVVQSILEN